MKMTEKNEKGQMISEERLWARIDCPPLKVLEIYRAVNEFIAEGVDMNRLRVSEITKRAGIGKGTAYEYFQSKEEMIGCAFLYSMIREGEKLWEFVRQKGSFREKMYALLDNIEQNFTRRREWCRYLDFYLQSMFDKRELMEKILNCPKIRERVKAFAKCLAGQAREENLIHGEPKVYFVIHACVTQIMGYVYFLERREHLTEITTEEMKEFLYQSILKTMQMGTV